eukprot:6462190-Amphidinium_carterae.1
MPPAAMPPLWVLAAAKPPLRYYDYLVNYSSTVTSNYWMLIVASCSVVENEIPIQHLTNEVIDKDVLEKRNCNSSTCQ